MWICGVKAHGVLGPPVPRCRRHILDMAVCLRPSRSDGGDAMGFLTSILGCRNHPQLDPGTAAASRLEERRQCLEQLVAKVEARLELVPASDAIYDFLGKPPGTFGLAWLKDGAEHNLKTLIQQRRLTSAEVRSISDSLLRVYEAHRGAERYQTTIAGKKVTVTPSEAFAADVYRAIVEITN